MYFLHDNLQWHIQREWSCVMSSDIVYEKKHTCSKVYVFGGWREVVFWGFLEGRGSYNVYLADLKTMFRNCNHIKLL